MPTSSFNAHFVLKNEKDAVRINKIVNSPAKRIPNQYPHHTKEEYQATMKRITKCVRRRKTPKK